MNTLYELDAKIAELLDTGFEMSCIDAETGEIDRTTRRKRMKLKINRFVFDNITDKDWILDNGCCYQCPTLKHIENSGSPYYISHEYWTIMSKTQFNKLLKQGIIERFEALENTERFKQRYSGCKAYRFKEQNDEQD